jgi:DNA modification methylase
MKEFILSNKNTTYATHGLHSYAAKCPPELVNYGLENYSQAGDWILDPMVGSGTTMVEAIIRGRNVIGFDIDPLACLISKVKSNYICDEKIVNAFGLVKSRVLRDLALLESNAPKSRVQSRAKRPEDFQNIDHWFAPEVVSALSLLTHHIANIPIEEDVRDFLWVAFSGIIIAKSSVANARDIIHSRSHFYEHPKVPNVMEKFEARVKKMQRHMLEFHKLSSTEAVIQKRILRGDARYLPLQNETVDLVFTSPPYATALDYQRAHFLAIGWMKKALNVTLKDYRIDGAVYIGSEKGTVVPYDKSEILSYNIIYNLVSQLEKVDKRKAFLFYRYFSDMQRVMSEIARVLKPSKHAIIVVCPSHIRKIQIPTHKALKEFGESFGLELVKKHIRTIDASKRILPYVRESFGERMSTEYVLVFRKG